MRWLMALLGPVDESEVDETPRSLRLWGRGEETGGRDDRPTGTAVDRDDRPTGFDRWALGLIGLVAAVLLLRVHSLVPSMSDTWYHLGVAKRIVYDGQIPGWDWWNYAPLGRPHLYPPALHVLIASLARFTGDVVLAGQVCAATFYPLALLSAWYCARRILGSRHALLAVLLMMTDLFHFVVMEAYIAGCIINILMPVLIVCVLSRRPWWAILCMTVMYYAHLGFPHCVALGLILFGLKYRSYLRIVLQTAIVGFIFFTPWLAHVVANLDWLAVLQNRGMPGGLLHKLLSLQAFNLLVLTLGFWGIVRAPHGVAARRMPIYLLLGFLPILFSYGGRYTMHTMPLWALLGASVIGRVLPVDARRRTVLGVMGLTLLPWPSLSMGMGDRPMPLPITGSHLLAMVAVTGRPVFDDAKKSEAYRPDCDALARWIERNCRPGEIIHVNKVWVADMISLLTDHPTDFGAWWECSKEDARLYGRAFRDWQQRGTFVYIKPEADAGSVLAEGEPMPGVDARLELGRFQIGTRRPHHLVPAAATPSLTWRTLQAPGAVGTVKSRSDGFDWRFGPSADKFAMVTASCAPLTAAGVGFTIEASRSNGDLVFGVRGPDGRDYRWPLSIPEKGVPERVRVVLDWTTDAEGRKWRGGPVAELYFARPPGPGAGGPSVAKMAPGKAAPELQVRVRDVRVLVESPSHTAIP